MKKLRLSILACLLSVGTVNVMPVAAEDYSDTDYWYGLCAGDSAQDYEEACEGFLYYIASQSDGMEEKIAELESEMAESQASIDELSSAVQTVQNDIEAMQREINTTEAAINDLQVQIDAQQVKIDAKQEEIDAKQEEIDARQEDVNTISEKIKKRMVSAQSTMRNNKYFDLLMGASSFEELLRIANGLAAIAEYDKEITDELIELIAELTEAQQQLEIAKEEMEDAKRELEEEQDELEKTKTELLSQQEALLLKKYQLELQKEQITLKYYELMEQEQLYMADLDEFKEMTKAVSEALNSIVSSTGWLNPVEGGRKSRGVKLNYNDYHLGIDIAAALGTTVRAAATGYVIKSVDGCGYGYLGSGCGKSQGGSYGGGNQVYMLATVNDSLYAIKYIHLLKGTPIAANQIVYQGDYIAQVGSSGNSSGPHCHVEVTYLGKMTIEEYIESWDGDLSFGCNWGNSALSHFCSTNGNQAPCRMIPEDLFGY